MVESLPTPHANAPRNLKKKQVENSVATTIFCIVIVFFALTTAINCLGSTSQLNNENRKASDLPQLKVLASNAREYFSGIEQFFADRFGFRQVLVSSRNWLLYSLFQTSGSDMVILGRDGMMFYNAKEARLAQTNWSPYSSLQRQDVAQNFAAKSEWLASHNIKYMLILVPEKGSLYPENLPSSLPKSTSPSRLEALQSEISSSKACSMLDAKELLTGKKRAGEYLFRKFDTHWTQTGALYVVAELFKELQLTPPSVQGIFRSIRGGDLANMLALSNVLEEDLAIFDMPDRKAQNLVCEIPEGGKAEDTSFASYKNDTASNAIKVFFICDSFTRMMMPFISEITSESTFQYSRKFDTRKILSRHPDLVVEEMVERHLYDLPLERAPEFVTLKQETDNKYATIGDSTGHPTFGDFSDTLELIDFAVSQDESGVSGKLLWRAKRTLNLSGQEKLKVLALESNKEIASLQCSQDFLERTVDTGDSWLDTFYIPASNDNHADKLALSVSLVDSRNIPIKMVAKQTADAESALILPFSQASGDKKLESLFRRKDARYSPTKQQP